MNSDDMIPRNEIEVYFDCPRCGLEHDEYVENAAYDYSVDNAADGIGTARTNITCQRCDLGIVIEIVARSHQKHAHLTDYPDTPVDFVEYADIEDGWERFLANYVPQEPFEVYTLAISEVEALKFEVKLVDFRASLYNKMLYVHYISILEAYLSDRLIKLVIDDQQKLLALVGDTDALREQKFSLIDLAKDPNMLVQRVKAYLQHFSFHDLERVEKFYKAVLKVSLFSDDEMRVSALNLIQDRHHLTHRNGKNNDGERVHVDAERVRVVEGLVKKIVNQVESAYRSYKHARELDEARRRRGGEDS